MAMAGVYVLELSSYAHAKLERFCLAAD